jgi:hypothetical protein
MKSAAIMLRIVVTTRTVGETVKAAFMVLGAGAARCPHNHEQGHTKRQTAQVV